MVTLCHALVLTSFESTLDEPHWDADYPVHFLYAREADAVLVHEDAITDPVATINTICRTLSALSIPYTLEKVIVVLEPNECEYCAEDIKQHL